MRDLPESDLQQDRPMRYRALCCDYDGTLAHDGRVSAATLAALERTRAAGRRLVMVTGRELPELRSVFDRLDLFERVVAENGALLHRPETGEELVLAPAPPASFAAALAARGVGPISRGRVIVATWEPHRAAVEATIRELGLELRVILNKEAVMVLPAGVDKSSGLAAALAAMKLSAHQAAGIGDAENDLRFLADCGLSAAVANALPQVKAAVDRVMDGRHGDGVVELVEWLDAADPPRGRSR
jgi:hydroxymethylpyrimidine pyrophosphatase-like HAD family hydrolase